MVGRAVGRVAGRVAGIAPLKGRRLLILPLLLLLLCITNRDEENMHGGGCRSGSGSGGTASRRSVRGNAPDKASEERGIDGKVLQSIEYADQTKSRRVFHMLMSTFNLKPIFVSSKVVYGLYDNTNYVNFSKFCYIKDRKKKGVVILSNMFIPNSKFLALDKTDNEIYDYANNKKGKMCEDLEKEALFIHSFDDMSSKSLNKPYFVYEKDIDISLTEKQLNFIILSCNNKIKNAFKIEFRNGSGFMNDHFSCEEQGLIEIYALLMVILAVLSQVYFQKRKELSDSKSELTESVHCAILFFLSSNILYLIHLIAYAFNGSGFSIFKVLSQIYEAICDCFVITILFYILSSKNNKEKRNQDTFRTALLYGVLKFFYVLYEIENNQELNLYYALHSVVALPFVVHRVVIAVLVHRNCKKLLKEKKKLEEKATVLFDSFLHFTHLFVHFCNLYILIYLVYNISERKYEALQSTHPYIEIK
ncbi:serpentine receptor, putative (SR12) [Plasmodium ovale wallikeri]|uniref:Serpentine receptor, putative (SR12) n=1 Tax=Plasmodium ovale wallikeri TaxID=864142 RepID=A0A1A8YND7_PLAOA|nr:serpentine receptor, putative (SR12) [Plasmodium ovale wallikeri]